MLNSSGESGHPFLVPGLRVNDFNFSLLRMMFVVGMSYTAFITLRYIFLCLLSQAMAPHSSTFAWKIPWTEKPDRLQSMGSLESDMTERLHFHFSLTCIGEGNGNPLQCSCLENPREGGA